MGATKEPSNRGFWKSYSRALAGALFFSFPLLMTMEMWWFGMYLDSFHLLIFILFFLPLLTGLSRYSGFRKTSNWFDDTLDTFVAVTAGALVSAVFLAVFGIIDLNMSADEIIGKIALLSVPGSMGAVIASKKLGSEKQDDEEKEQASYGGELFIMVAGALFLAFNVAPTEEMVLIAYKMNYLQTIVLVLLSLLIMHALLFTLEFKSRPAGYENASPLRLVLFFTVVGYAVVLLVSSYILWVFGRFQGLGLSEVIKTTAVLGFPAALGASTARLVV